jgi:hypothetical protein
VVLVMGGGDGMGKLEAITQTLPVHLVRAGATFIFSFLRNFLNTNFYRILINKYKNSPHCSVGSDIPRGKRFL